MKNEFIFHIMAQVYRNDDRVAMTDLCRIMKVPYVSFYRYMQERHLFFRKLRRKARHSEEVIFQILQEISNPKVSLAAIHKKYGIAPTTVRQWAKDYGYNDIKFNRKVEFPEHVMQEAVQLYYGGMNAVAAARAVGIGKHTFRKYLKQHNLLKKVITIQPDITYDSSFFDVLDTEEKAYWFGFILADGNVRNRQVSIELSAKDKAHLDKFNVSIKGNLAIKSRLRKSPSSCNEYEQVHLTVSSSHMSDALIQKGCVPRKTYTGQLVPNLFQEEYLVSAFIRGYFDGNGCIPSTKRGMVCQIDAGNYNYAVDIAQYITEYLNIVPAFYQHGPHCTRIMILKKQDTIRFLDFIYKDANIFLDRKYNLYLQAVQSQRV